MATLSGGDKLRQKLVEIAKGMESGELSVGFMSGATYPDGTPVAQVAFWNEFGTTRSPARPFFRKMIERNSEAWPDVFAKAAKASRYNTKQALSMVGEKISDQLQSSIVGWTEPGNAPSTISAKGFDKPLIDSGQMQRSITYNVKTGGD
jgi:hypothetical protein